MTDTRATGVSKKASGGTPRHLSDCLSVFPILRRLCGRPSPPYFASFWQACGPADKSHVPDRPSHGQRGRPSGRSPERTRQTPSTPAKAPVLRLPLRPTAQAIHHLAALRPVRLCTYAFGLLLRTAGEDDCSREWRNAGSVPRSAARQPNSCHTARVPRHRPAASHAKRGSPSSNSVTCGSDKTLFL